MKVSAVNNQSYLFGQDIMDRNPNQSYHDGDNAYAQEWEAYLQVDENKEQDILGICMVRQDGTNAFYGMRAEYAKDSTEADPVICVTSNMDGEQMNFYIRINNIDPDRASQLEMFALCSYADQKGIGTSGTFGSYNVARCYKINAESDGAITTGDAYQAFLTEKINWRAICMTSMNDYYNAGVLEQYQQGQELMGMFDYLD